MVSGGPSWGSHALICSSKDSFQRLQLSPVEQPPLHGAVSRIACVSFVVPRHLWRSSSELLACPFPTAGPFQAF